MAQLQVNGARSLMNGELAPVTGAVRSVHTYLNMYVTYLTTFNK
jgi:neutral ceramidase